MTIYTISNIAFTNSNQTITIVVAPSTNLGNARLYSATNAGFAGIKGNLRTIINPLNGLLSFTYLDQTVPKTGALPDINLIEGDCLFNNVDLNQWNGEMYGLSGTPPSIIYTDTNTTSSDQLISDIGDGRSVEDNSGDLVWGITSCCLHADTQIETNRGFKKISNIVSGDFVRGTNGQFIQIENNIKFSQTNSFVKIPANSLGLNEPKQDTYIHGGHPILHKGKEIVPNDLINDSNYSFEQFIDEKPTTVYSLLAKDRTVFKANGELLVFTWEMGEWNEYVKNNPYIFFELQ